ncbi:hypothetical protein [Thauera sp. Sel9]|uniref:hypothetical protein n=1 Tax=Thauera sp. Sel9 TaxID=2974299 RepID=UPI0021E130F9|nr:hypothetical protein [Thauera sp. Sel9]MCV2217664.1 hypothetical protein [Thauera sp. Sel9]
MVMGAVSIILVVVLAAWVVAKLTAPFVRAAPRATSRREEKADEFFAFEHPTSPCKFKVSADLDMDPFKF